MVTGFDIIHHNKPLQKHWIKRILAYLTDFFISSLLAFIPLFILDITFFDSMWLLSPTAGALQVFYSAAFEYYNRQTIGKKFFDLEVEGLRGGMDMHEAIIRNISKIHGLVVFLDTVLGLATEGDPRQRYMDRVADTTVKGSSEHLHIMDHFSIHRRPPPEEESHTHFMERGLSDIRRCRECGGGLEAMDLGQSRCRKCGRIQ